jgi:hypothetical protein
LVLISRLTATGCRLPKRRRTMETQGPMRPELYEERLGWYYAKRLLSDGRELVVLPLLTGTARLIIGPVGADWYSDGW